MEGIELARLPPKICKFKHFLWLPSGARGLRHVSEPNEYSFTDHQHRSSD